MNAWSLLLAAVLLAGCASAPVPPPDERLFGDRRFRAPTEPISAHEVFALSDAMRRYVRSDIAGTLRERGRQQGLFDALYARGQLRIEYESAITRNAAQTFAARSGNCLSLAIMTAAFARELGLTVRYQTVEVDETWGRNGDIFLFIGHVNVTLSPNSSDVGMGRGAGDPMTIDFVSPRELRGLRARELTENRIVAMYMNNRAVESLANGRVDDGYWWARAAIMQDPAFMATFNTLGVVYQRHGDLDQAREVFEFALEREPRNTQVMSNLAALLRDQGRTADAGALTRRLAQMEPEPPFHYYNLGRAAMRRGDFKAARDLFEREVDRAGYYHEFHYWLALAYANLGQVEPARRHLAIAMENSDTRGEHDLYAAKLARIDASRAK